MTAISIMGRTASSAYLNQRNLERVTGYQQDLASGTRVRSLSDDPVAGRRSLLIQAQQQRGESYIRNIDRAMATSNVLDDTMAEMVTIFDEIKSIAVEGANGTQDANSRAALAQSIGAQFERFVDLANARHEGRYLFAGTNVQTPPFEQGDAGRVIYQGSLDDVHISIGDGVDAPIARNGHAVFLEGNDVFRVITDLRDALLSDDQFEVSEMFARIDQSHDQILAAQGDLGGRMQRFEAAHARLEQADVQLQALNSELVDTDMAATIQKMQAAQVALEAGLQTAARVLQPSLLDYL